MSKTRLTVWRSLSGSLAVGLAAACGDDAAVQLSGTGGGEGTGGTGGGPTSGVDSGDASSGSADESGGGGAEGGGPPCGFEGMLGGPGPTDYQLVTLPAAGTPGQHFELEANVACDFPGIYDGSLLTEQGARELNRNDAESDFHVYVYHPQDANGEWPVGLENRPAIFFSPANGNDAFLVEDDGAQASEHRYAELMQTLVEAGFVVFGMQPVGESMNSGRRRSALACMMIWARDQWDPGGRLSEYMALMGHSRGGGGAYLLTEDLLDGEGLPDATLAPSLWQWRQCATATFAQRFGESIDSAEFTVTPVTHAEAPPFLTIAGASDEDTRTQGILAYDNRFSETLANEDSTLDTFDELALVVHARPHGAWGGLGQQTSAIAPYYVDHFLRWQMMGEDASRRRFMDLVDAQTDACAFEDVPESDPSDWSGDAQVYYSGCQGADPPAICSDPAAEDLQGMGRALIRADFGQGTGPVGADRLVLDTLDHAINACERYSTEFDDLSASSSGRRVVLAASTPVDEDGPCVCVGSPSNLLGGYAGTGAPAACDPPSAAVFGNPDFTAHDGAAMLVNFGGEAGPASIQWSLAAGDDAGLPFSIAEYTHVSVRVGNVVADPSEDCDPDHVPDEFEVTAEIEDADASNPAAAQLLGRLVESDRVLVTPGMISICNSSHFMQTLRVPLARYCAQGQFSPYDATAITLHFDDPERTHAVLIDSIELVRDPDGSAVLASCSSEALDPCPVAAPSSWNCEATGALAVDEVSCAGEPISGVCDPGDVVQTPIDLPVVDEGLAGEFAGWVVNVPRGWLRDPQQPSVAEQGDIVARCVAACELEYADRPEVVATCSAEGAFATPTLRDSPDRGASVSIADARAGGSGIFSGAALDCDLRDDCADAFDEDLAIARMRRPTSASEPIGRGEEWRLDLAGAVEADSSDATAAVAASLTGSIGYSECAAGNDEGPCPFYLGSLELELEEPLTLTLECGGPPEVHVLDALALRLVQPAFGIAEQDSDWRGFPSGALVLAADGVVDGEPFSTVGPVRRDFSLVAADGWAQLQGTGGSYLELTVPCGGGTSDVVAWLGFSAVAWPGEPPSVTIDVPSALACPSLVSLDKSVTDQEMDIASVRWRVDGVLIDEATDALVFTTGHTLDAIVRDERGATRTKRKLVACE